jgi:hypothetical protein
MEIELMLSEILPVPRPTNLYNLLNDYRLNLC